MKAKMTLQDFLNSPLADLPVNVDLEAIKRGEGVVKSENSSKKDSLRKDSGKELDEAIAKANIPLSDIEESFTQLNELLGIKHEVVTDEENNRILDDFKSTTCLKR